jgi:flagellin
MISAKISDNLSGALSYLQSQADGVNKMAGIIGAMSDLVSKMQDATKGSADLQNYMTQFNGLRQDLVQARKEKYGELDLHDRTGTGTPIQVSLDGSTKNVLNLTQTDFLTQGAGALLALLGSSAQDFESSSAPAQTDETGYGSETSTPSTTLTGQIVGEEGWGTEATNSPQALVQWGVAPLNSLLSSMSALLSINASQQQRVTDAIDGLKSRNFDLESAESKITDIDVAHEVLNLAKSNMRTQAGTAAMAQANASADSVARALYGGAGAGIQWYQSILA